VILWSLIEQTKRAKNECIKDCEKTENIVGGGFKFKSQRYETLNKCFGNLRLSVIDMISTDVLMLFILNVFKFPCRIKVN